MSTAQRSTRDELERIVLSNIAEYGWHAVNIVEDNGCPPWTFTIGLYETWKHPELIVVGRCVVRLAGPFGYPYPRPAPVS